MPPTNGWDAETNTYYIDGVATTLDSTGYGDFGSPLLHYSSYPTLWAGGDTTNNKYYVNGVEQEGLDSCGNGGISAGTRIDNQPVPYDFTYGVYYGYSSCAGVFLMASGHSGFLQPVPGLGAGGYGDYNGYHFSSFPTLFNGWDATTSTYYIDGVATTLNSDGTGCWNNEIYTAGSVTFNPATDTGYNTCDSIYYISGVATALDSTGYGDYDGNHYSAYPTLFEGWDTATNTYYFAGVATTLDRNGTGDYSGALYLNGSPVVDGTTPRYFSATNAVSLESTNYWEVYLDSFSGPGPFTCYSPPTSADNVNVNTYPLSGSSTVNNLYLSGTSLNYIDSYLTSTATVTVLGAATVGFGYTNSGNITCANVSFSAGSWNLGTVTGNASFDNSRNIGTVTGNATFGNNSENTNDRNDLGYWGGSHGTVSGNATFNDTSTNNGVVSGTATFAGKRFNTGTVGTAVYTPTSPTTIYVADGGSDNNDGTEAHPLANPQRAFEMAYYWAEESARTIHIDSGSFGAVNLNIAYADNWPVTIQIKGVSSATSSIGGIIAVGNDMVFDYGANAVVSNPTDGKNVTVISDNTVNLGNIITTGGNSGVNGVGVADIISGGNSGNIVLTNCTAGVLVTDGGGQFYSSTNGGVGSTGSVTITNSTVSDIYAVSATLAGNELSGSSGNAGVISLTDSTAGGIYASASSFNFTYGDPAAIPGGVITLDNSTAGNIVVNGGDITYSNVNTSYSNYFGGVGGSVALTTNSHAGSIVASGGAGGDTSNTSGSGGVVRLTDSTANDIIVAGANGGNNGYGQGGSGGSVTLVRSTSSNINSVGGNGGDGSLITYGCGDGGNGGVVSLTDSSANNIFVFGGSGNSSGADQAYGGHAGSITLVRSNVGPLYGVGGSGGTAATLGSDPGRTATGGNGGYISLTDSNSGDINTFGGSGGSINSVPNASRGNVGTIVLVGNCILPNNIIGNLDISDLNKGRGINGSNILGIL
jgi:hypothetical protein